MAFSKVADGPFGATPTWKVILGMLFSFLAIVTIWVIAAIQVHGDFGLEPIASAPPATSADDTTAAAPAATAQLAQVAQELASQASAAAQTYNAVLTCRIQGVPMPVSACIVGSSSEASGSLKIVNGDSVKQYADVEVMQEFPGQTAEISLHSNFEVTVQPNSLQGVVMRLEIHDGAGHAVYANEASAMGVLRASH